FLDAWEITLALVRRRREMRFEFDYADLVDRNPPGPGEPVEASATLEARVAFSLVARALAPTYPDPPVGFVASEDVRTLMYHYEGYVAGRQRLVDMAYFVLTLLEQRGIDDAKARGATKVNKLQAASQLYGVDPKVLRTLGRISTVR